MIVNEIVMGRICLPPNKLLCKWGSIVSCYK